MEKEIELLKKKYLETPTPMTETEGFSDILYRLEEKPVNKFRDTRLFVFGLTLLFVLLISATLLIFPESKTTTAVKALGQTVVDNIIKPTITPLPSPSMNSLKSKPTSTPVPTQKVTVTPPKSKPNVAPGTSVSNDKRMNNPTTNDEEVKGASTSRGRNENAGNNPGKNNPSEEKSQDKKDK